MRRHVLRQAFLPHRRHRTAQGEFVIQVSNLKVVPVAEVAQEMDGVRAADYEDEAAGRISTGEFARI